MSSRVTSGLLGAFALIAGVAPAIAHTIVGDRVFPATLAIDDPGVNDELALPTFATMTAANPDHTPGPISYTLGWEYAKRITSTLAFSIGSEGYSWQKRPEAEGWANIETQLKYVFWQDPTAQSIVAGAVNVEWGGTGSPQSASLPSDPFSTVTLKLYAGKGFGDASADWLQPFAVTGEIDYSLPTTTINADGGLNPTMLSYGATLQYSLMYMNSFVRQLPAAFRRLVPAFEAAFATPISDVPATAPGDFNAHATTGVIGPSLYYMGQYFEIGAMAQIPINRASGAHVGAIATIDFFLDDIAPNSLGKPLFGPSQPHGRY